FSAESVKPCKARREQLYEQCGREADDVEVVALDAFDERRAETLDRVAAGAALPLARGDVRGDVPRVERAKGDACRLGVELLPARSDEAEPGDDLVRGAAEG